MKLLTYPVPEGVKKNTDYSVRVCPAGTSDFIDVGVFNATVANNCYSTYRDHSDPENLQTGEMAFCSFFCDFETPVTVEVRNLTEYGDEINIRPKEPDIPVAYGPSKIAYFFVDKPQKFSIEFDGDIVHNLFLFAEKIDENKPDPTDENVIYFPEGVHEAGDIVLKENQTLYLDMGAFVYGRVFAENINNISIKGGGILCGERILHELWLSHRGCMCSIKNCENVTIDGVIILDSPAWSISMTSCKEVSINNLKEISYYQNTLGIAFVGCENVVCKDSIIRSGDDCIAVKSEGGDNRNILVKNCILWNDCAHAMLIGPESGGDKRCVFENITFTDITVLYTMEHNPDYMGCMALMCANNANYRNITFSNIVIERMDMGKLFHVGYIENNLGNDIKNITFDTISYMGMHPLKNTVIGFDEKHTVKGVKIRNFMINGKFLTGPNNYVETNDFAKATYTVKN